MSVLIQQSQEWLDYRKTKVGASDAPIIMGVSPWKTPYQLWLEKNDLLPATQTSFAMRRGIRLEDTARAYFSLEVGIDVSPKVVVHNEYGWMIASLDGLSDDKKTAVEIKCPGEEDHAKALAGMIPEKYYPQLQHQLEVLTLDKLYYYSFDGNDGVLLEVGRDDRYIKGMVKKELAFWECLNEFRAPDMTERDFQLRNDDVWKKKAELLIEARTQLKYWEGQEAQIKEWLIETSNQQNTMGGGIKLSRCNKPGNIDYKAIPELKNVDLELYRKPSTYYWKIANV